MPRTKITSAFKAPRQVTGKEGGSGKDEVEGPLVTGRRHRKDNSEWGKRMEKELAQIEKRSEVAVQKTARRDIYLDSDRETDCCIDYNPPNTYHKVPHSLPIA